MSTGQVACLAFIIITGIGLFCTSVILFWFTGGDIPFDYGITVDAGSSKTAFYLYDWSAKKVNDTGLVRQLHVEQVRNGIDDFGEDTTDLTRNLIGALSRLSHKIDYTSKNYLIPIYLGATAGMRILQLENNVISSKILQNIKHSFDMFAVYEKEYKVKNVEIISGTKEGLYCWIATNYLMKFIPEEQIRRKGTIGTLDMGGASAQIAFQVGPSTNIYAGESSSGKLNNSAALNASTNPNAITGTSNNGEESNAGLVDDDSNDNRSNQSNKTPESSSPSPLPATLSIPLASLGNEDSNSEASLHKPTEKTRLFGKEYQISTFSNLCYGNDDARKRFQMLLILQHPESRVVQDPCTHPRQLNRSVPAEEVSKNVCTYDENGNQRKLSQDRYTFAAKPNEKLCVQYIRKLVSVESVRTNFKDYGFQQLEQSPPKNMKFFAISTFYFAAKQLRNRDVIRFADGTEFAKAISEYCARNWDEIIYLRKPQEIMYLQNYCFSLNYVYLYLKHVYKFDDKQFNQIEFRGQLEGHSLGWALGYMLQETNSIPGSGPKPPIINGLWFAIIVIFSAALMLIAAGSVVKQHVLNKGEYMASQVSPMSKQSRV